MKKKKQSNESNKRRVYSCRRSWFSQSDVIEICFRFQMKGFSHCQKVFESRSNSESALVSIINKTKVFKDRDNNNIDVNRNRNTIWILSIYCPSWKIT